MSKVISEIGINHKGSFLRAKQLIIASKEAGCWAVKFQYRRKKNFYINTHEIGDEIINDEFKRSNLNQKQIISLLKFCKKIDIKCGISFFNSADINDFSKSEINLFDFFKVPSAEFQNDDLINSLKSLKKDIFISCGGHSEKEILSQVNKYRKEKLIFMHCISNYPTLLGNQQLNFIKTLVKKTNNPVGYSSHDKNWEACLISLALGVKYIERHITFDKNGDGLDESSSSEPGEMKLLCEFCSNFENIIGSGSRVINQGEIMNIQNLGSSLYASKNIKSGEVVTSKNTFVSVPKKGITLHDLSKRKNRRVRQNIKKGEPISINHFNNNSNKLSKKFSGFCNKNKLSIPVRMHDINFFINNFDINNYELHLSYGELNYFNSNKKKFVSKLDLNKSYSIHLPDYLEGNRLIDPLSENKQTRKDSIKSIDTCLNIADEIAKSENDLKIVGSFSRINNSKKTTYLELKKFIDQKKRQSGHQILPQWLPKIAWYFGGAEKLNIFCDEDDISFIEKLKLEICLDISHLILSANYQRKNWHTWYDRLIKFTRHIHLSDAKGIDFEGIKFGSGDLEDKYSKKIMNEKIIKVLEIWQGHLMGGRGFKNSISYLKKLKDER